MTERRRFAYRPSAPVARVDLLGELSDWRNPIALVPEPDGTFACALDLRPGVYGYKFLVHANERDVTWALDPENPRTRSSAGRRNSVAVVGGAPEPWLFAPAAPWITELDGGGVRVLVGVRFPALEPPTVAWSEDGGASWSRTRLAHAFDEDEHALFVATLPVSAPSLLVAIEADGLPRFDAKWTRRPAAERAPAWWKRAIVYTVLVDRFRPAEDRASFARDPGPHGAAGGHLDGIRRSLPELVDLGVDVLYLTPVHVGASSHRYDVVDPLTIDPLLGGEAAYAALVEDARALGVRVVQDVSFGHVGRGFPAYEDVERHGPASRWAPWFVWKNGQLVHYGERTDAPLLDQTNPQVQALVLDAIASWAKRGVSGLRLDMTAEVPIELGRRIRRRFRELVPDGVVFGEVVPEHAWRWIAEGVVDAATDFGLQETVTKLVCDAGASAADAFAQIARVDLLRGVDAHVQSVRFVSTHDHPRLATLARANGATDRLALAYALVATLPGVPMLLYGEEVGLASAEPGRDLEDVWPDRMPMAWSPLDRDLELRALVRSLLHARRASEALRAGSVQLLFADETTLVYRREAPGEIVDVALNFDRAAKTIELEDDENPRVEPVVAIGGAAIAGAALTMPPCSALIGRRRAGSARAIPPMHASRNLALRDQDLVAASPVAAARPSRFLFSITERCNLRCEHCITHAPERTRTGAARTMTSAVLGALVPHLGFADYFAFVHGGESLTAPIFFDVLDAIAGARGPSPYVAHLLTNGVLLDVKTAERLVTRGVSSISVSLDGATAETNDQVRLGGRFRDVVENVRAVVRWRAAEAVDLRVGLSFVVLRQNVHELSAFVELGASLGVDWIKLEEGVPATPFAKRSLVSASEASVRRAIDAAVARGRERGIVMVDHTLERAVWRCRLDDETRAFLEADEHANRTTIHPCRTPWETACIEPNGDVRAGDFFGPILGNVTQASLDQLWNAPPAQQLRRDAGLSRLCAPSGPVECVAPSPQTFTPGT